MSLKLYYDLMSQPSRALYIALHSAKTPFVSSPVALRKGAHLTDDFAKINRFQRVPLIEHNGFVLTESVAILRYLVREKLLPETLYPLDSKSQAQVDEYMEWQHIGLRLHCSLFFRVKHMDPILTNTKPDEMRVLSYTKRMETALNIFENKWLRKDQKYLIGDEPTFADLLAACELEQPRMADYDPTEHYPNIAAWMTRVRQHFSPHYEEAHEILNKIVKKSQLKNKTASKL